MITESAGLLGEGLGDLAKQVTGFVGEISSVVSDLNAGIREKFPDWFSEANKPAAQAVIDGVTGSADSAASWVQDKTGFNTRSVGHAVKGWLGIDDQPTGTAVEQYG
ncbi:hypothetical protein UXP29_23400, partial [Enterobacter hormaechei]